MAFLSCCFLKVSIYCVDMLYEQAEKLARLEDAVLNETARQIDLLIFRKKSDVKFRRSME